MEEFKNLNLKIEDLANCIKEYCDTNNITYSLRANGKNQRLTLSCLGKDALVDIYHNNKGTTTLHYKIGHNPEIGYEICKYIKQEITIDERPNINLSAIITEDQFRNIIEFFEEFTDDDNENVFEIEEIGNDNGGSKYHVKSVKYKDNLNITYYPTTSNLLVQGKPLFVYSQLLYFLSEYLDTDGYVTIVSKYSNKELVNGTTPDLVKLELQRTLPKVYDNLDNILKVLLSSCLTLKLSGIELPDYSVITLPALRALEGVIRKILFVNGIEINGNLKCFIPSSKGSGYELEADYKDKLSGDVQKALCRCYNYYHKQRHGISHMDCLIESSRIIENKNDACRIIDKVLTLINENFIID